MNELINYKYGMMSQSQLDHIKKRIHSLIHWLLIYAENEEYDVLNDYFNIVQSKLNGFNSVLNYPDSLGEIVVLVESAKKIDVKNKENYHLYRKIILDIHDLIEEIN